MLPFALLAMAAVAGGYGVKKGVDAHKDNRQAKKLAASAEHIFASARDRLARARASSTETLEGLGRRKLRAWDADLGRFVALFEQLKAVELEGASEVQQLGAAAFSRHELMRMKELSGYAREVTAGGIGALGSGALVGMATYGGATMFASASTGTAIATLGGAAATNATLAWFGGGALAAGGFGMAGGMVVLGGIVAGPVLAVGGVVLAAKARTNLARASANKSKARQAAAQMHTARALVEGIEAVATDFQELIGAVSDRFGPVLDELEAVIAAAGTHYADFDEAQRRTVHVSVVMAQVLKVLLETPILKPDGGLHPEHVSALERGRLLLAGA